MKWKISKIWIVVSLPARINQQIMQDNKTLPLTDDLHKKERVTTHKWENQSIVLQCQNMRRKI